MEQVFSEEMISSDKIIIIMNYILPGFISLKIWTLLNASKKTKISESIIEAICYSAINVLFFSSVLPLVNSLHYILKSICIFFILFIAPIIWPILLHKLLRVKKIQEKIINPIPSSWDYFFAKRETCFLLIHLKNNAMIGGLYHDDSYASSYPEVRDLYLKEVWSINKKGKFLKKVNNSRGLLINYDIIEYIEIFDAFGGNYE